MDVKLLLLQARRASDLARHHERECFAASCGLELSQVIVHDLLQGLPSLGEVRDHTALLLGGSGEFYVSKRNLPGFRQLLEFTRKVVDVGHPTFASCFGYHLMIEALGGEMVHDPERSEVGTYDLELTPEGRADPLFGTLPRRFAAQLGHKDRPHRQPSGIVNLASSERSPLQALRIPGKPIWATQFHTELDRANNLSRFDAYAEDYTLFLGEEGFAKTRAGFRESPEASTLLRTFLKLIEGRI